MNLVIFIKLENIVSKCFAVPYTLHMPCYIAYHSINPDKVLSRLGPGRELYVADRVSLLRLSHVVFIAIQEHVREVVKLWYQLL